MMKRNVHTTRIRKSNPTTPWAGPIEMARGPCRTPNCGQTNKAIKDMKRSAERHNAIFRNLHEFQSVAKVTTIEELRAKVGDE